MSEGHTKDTCQLREDQQQELQLIRTKYYYKICREITSHLTEDCPYNLKNRKEKWCTICEENSHDIVNCVLNMESKKNYHTMY